MSKAKSFKKFKFGYTMIELLVAIGIFSVVTAIAVGGFAQALKTHRQALSIMAANGNLSNALEQMIREIRTGRNFSVGAGDSSLSFENTDREFVTYELVDGSITRASLSPASKITDSNVIVRQLKFTHINLANYPSRIVINIGISPSVNIVSDAVSYIQTTVSSRNF